MYSLTHRGFAFVVFVEKGSISKVLETMPHTIRNRQVDVKLAIPHAQHQVSLIPIPPCIGTGLRPRPYVQAIKNRTKKIFVGGVPTDMTKETLQEYFEKYGEVSDKKIIFII